LAFNRGTLAEIETCGKVRFTGLISIHMWTTGVLPGKVTYYLPAVRGSSRKFAASYSIVVAMPPPASSRQPTSSITRRAVVAAALSVVATRWLWSGARRRNSDAALPAFAHRLTCLMGLTDGSWHIESSKIYDAAHLSNLIGKLLEGNSGDLERFATLNDTALRDRLRNKILVDFELGRIHLVHGWLLSATEKHALNLKDYLHGSLFHH